MDHNATTPVAAEALDAMLPYLTWNYGNASSIHEFGIQARYGIEKARMQVAKLINAPRPEDVVFTGCGSESDNIAIRGLASLYPGRKHIITSAVEHKAILESCHEMEVLGYEVTYLPVNRECKVSPADLARAIRPDTLVVSIMFANNETGVIQPIAELARIARERGVCFHTDAVQAAGRVPIDVQATDIDLLSMSAHKLYGPKGIGALYIRPGLKIRGVIVGGAHERGIRAGTENVAGIAGFGAAAALARKGMDQETETITGLRRQLWNAITSSISGVKINGHPDDRLPGTLNLCFDGISGQRLVTEMNGKGVAISAGSACTSVGTSHSHVLLGMGFSKDEAAGSVRISLGRANSAENIPYILSFLPDLIKQLREEFRQNGGAMAAPEC
ncbi:cysteine desulfurase [Candidatus Sumerlaeota bacterium]|nr:cysteine desulfurase [Candidatus Sumerlaeota bacterium]